MGDDKRTDFLQWLLAELDREGRAASLHVTAGSAELVCLSELEATALLIVVLSAERRFSWNEPLMELAHRMAGAITGHLEQQSNKQQSNKQQ